LFQIQLDDNTVADFLADIKKTGRKKKTTVYRFVGLSKSVKADKKGDLLK
jgi:hypothetical protein